MRDFAKNNGCGDDTLAKIDTWLVKKTPDRYEVKIPQRYFTIMWISCAVGSIKGWTWLKKLYGKARPNAFSVLRRQIKQEIEPEIEREVIGDIISRFRDNTGTPLRYGILDSAPDIDCAPACEELDAAVVASDMGIQKWAEQARPAFVNAKSFLR